MKTSFGLTYMDELIDSIVNREAMPCQLNFLEKQAWFILQVDFRFLYAL